MFFTKKDKEKYESEIAVLKHEIAELKQIIKTQELINLRAENSRLKEKERNISKVKFKLKDVTYLSGENIILVKYDVPQVRLTFNDENELNKNEMFYAINKLNLISYEDMRKIQAVIDNTKKKQQ